MTDQPVTPDREAPDCPPWSNEALDAAHAAYLDLLVSTCGGPIIRDYPSEMLVVETILTAVTDKLSRNGNEGCKGLTDALDRARQQGRDEAAAAIEVMITGKPGVPATWTDALYVAAALARGGPNRKDEE